MKFSLIFAVFAALAAAVPLNATVNDDDSVSPFDLDTFALYAEYAAAAYCNVDVDPGTPLACPMTRDDALSTCPTLEATSGVQVTQTLHSDDTGVKGFVARDPTRGLVVVAFRGTHSLVDYATDLDHALVPCHWHLSEPIIAQAGRDCQVHDGFGRAWHHLRDRTLAAVLDAVAQTFPQDAVVVVTGHALGAAVATLAALELRGRGQPTALYTYGSPRVGNEALAAFLTMGQLGAVPGGDDETGSAPIAHYRITHGDDPVPRKPSLRHGFAHTSPEFWLAGRGAPVPDTPGFVAYSPDDVAVCPGYTSEACNGGQEGNDRRAHEEYFEPIAGCAPWGFGG